MARFRKVTLRDNWGHVTYWAGETEVKYEDNEKIDIQWKDGTVETVKILKHVKTVSVSDMGHDYIAKSPRYMFETKVHGTPVYLDLHHVKVQA